jgi:hypothetical protein
VGAREQGIIGTRQSKIDHHGAPLRIHHNVGRLQVAVDDSVLMRILDGATHAEQQGEALRPSQRIISGIGGQGQPPVHQFHHEIRELLVRTGVFVQPPVVDPGNAVVLQRDERVQLGQKLGAGLFAGRPQQGGMNELHGHGAPGRTQVLLRPVDHAHASRPEELLQGAGAHPFPRTEALRVGRQGEVHRHQREHLGVVRPLRA